MDIVDHPATACKRYSPKLSKKNLFDIHLVVIPVGMEHFVINVNNFVYSIKKDFFIFVAICSPSCVNGNCTYPDVCNCSTGWEDSICSTREYSFKYELRFLKT